MEVLPGFIVARNTPPDPEVVSESKIYFIVTVFVVVVAAVVFVVVLNSEYLSLFYTYLMNRQEISSIPW